MNIIGWVAIIYIFIGCGFMMWFYAVLYKHDYLDSFIDSVCEEFESLGLKIGEHAVFMEVMFTLLLIMGWTIMLTMLIVEKILISRKKDRAD